MPERIHVITQNFKAAELSALSIALQDYGSLVNISNYKNTSPSQDNDIRVRLLNHGVSLVSSELLHILDFDDLIYQDAYMNFSHLAKRSDYQSMLYFQRVERCFSKVYKDFDYACKVDMPFKGTSLADLYEDNFCPIHSYVTNIRLAKQLEVAIFFDERYRVLEDYNFLLRYSKYGCDFSGLANIIGLYNFRDDGTNTTVINNTTTLPHSLLSKMSTWEEGRKLIAEHKAAMEITY